MNKRVWLQALCAGTALAGLALPAAAQTAGTAAVANDESADEVIVTAQRRSERLVDVPISITAVTGDAMEASGITTMDSLDRLVPGLTFYVTASHASPTIRGVGSTLTGPGADNPVAVYVDGVYQSAASSLLFDFDNVQQVEVLRGPQGTLFGRNATGGAIRVTTYDPSDDAAFRGTVSYDNLNTTSVRGYANIPLVENILAFNIAGLYREGESYITNLYTGDEVGGPQVLGFNPKLRWTPNNDLEFVLSATYMDHSNNRFEAFSPYLRPTSQYVSNPSFQLPGQYETNTNILPHWDTHTEGASFRASWDTDWGTFSSVTGWTDYHGNLRYDLDFSPANTGYVNIRDDASTYSQELNFASGDWGRFHLVGGLFFYDDTAKRDQPVHNGADAIFAGYEADIFTNAQAAYAELTYDITDQLHITVGERYSEEEKEFHYHNIATNARGEATANWSDWTPRAVLRYEVTPNSSLYASYSQGFKSGVFNPSANPAPPTLTNAPVEPEEVTAYEVGYHFGHGGTTFSAAAFFNEYSNIQVNIQLSPLLGLAYQNAGSAEIYGLELEGGFDLTDELRLTGSAAFTHGEYTEFANAPISDGTLNPVTYGDVSGNDTTRTPEVTANLGLTYTHEFASGGTLGANVSASYNSGYYPAPDNRLATPSYTTINGEISWTTPDDRYRIALFGRNITDENKLLYLAAAALDFKIDDEPQVYGISLSANFN